MTKSSKTIESSSKAQATQKAKSPPKAKASNGTADVAQSAEAVAEARQSAPIARAGRSSTVATLVARDTIRPELLLNRELSLLEFQKRVLEEAQDPDNFLLERIKFLAIVASNLDEFMMVRAAGLQQQVAAGVAKTSPDGLTPAEQLASVRDVVGKLMDEMRSCLKNLTDSLTATGIKLLDYNDLKKSHRKYVDKRFREAIFPALTPLAFDPGRPFPHISNLSLNLAVLVRGKTGREHFARIKVPRAFPRLMPVKESSGGVRKDGTVPHDHSFVWLEQVIIAHLDELFPGMEVVEAHPFHVTRNADFVIQELEASDLLESIAQGVRTRRFGSVVRLTIPKRTPRRIRHILRENLVVDENDVYTVDGPLALSGLMSLVSSVDRFDLKDPPTTPVARSEFLSGTSPFDVIDAGDILIHRPYESFSHFLDFLQAAARDPNVLAIKQTLYRTGQNSPVVRALLEARERGKQVTVLLELKARFDEESNMYWAKALESEGVHVVYGLLGLKTHSKVAMVVRKDNDVVKRYVHLSTGNYNANTAKLYTDLSLFTADDAIGEDVTHLFNFLTGYSEKDDYKRLLVAPKTLRRELTRLIKREMKHGSDGHLMFKMNALVDPPIIKLLYNAARAGVKIEMLIRGICCLRPGVAGVSDNIEVRSIVGRYLEHSRIYWFKNGGNSEVYLGSADLMPRNIDRRVEVITPVHDAGLVGRIRNEVLETYWADNVKSRRLLPDGSYERVNGGESRICAQEELMARALATVLETEESVGRIWVGE